MCTLFAFMESELPHKNLYNNMYEIQKNQTIHPLSFNPLQETYYDNEKISINCVYNGII